MEKKTEVRNLKIISWLFIFLGLWDIAYFLIKYFRNTLNISELLTKYNMDAQLESTVLITSIVIVAIVAFVKIFIGCRGLSQAKGNKNAKGHIILLVIILIVYVLLMLSVILLKNKNISEIFLNSIINITIISTFIKSSLDVKNLK